MGTCPDANVDEAIEHYRGVLKTDPGAIHIITPVRAAAVYIEKFVRAPLSKAASVHPQPTSGVFDNLTRGIYYLSSALVEAEGALSHGVPMQVLIELSEEARHLTPEARDQYLAQHKQFRTFLTNRRVEVFMKDKTGGLLLWNELSDMIDLRQNVLPYFKDVPMYPDTINSTSILGGEFVIDAYRMLYPLAREKLGEGLVVSQ